MKAEVGTSTCGATGKVVAPWSQRPAGPVATGRVVVSRRGQAIGRRSESVCWARQQGRSEGRWSRPNPRLQWTGHTAGHVLRRAVSRSKLVQCQGSKWPAH